MDLKTIEHLAELSELKFSEIELNELQKDFESLIGLADEVKNSNIEGVTHVNSIDMNLLREDKSKTCVPVEVLLQNAPVEKQNSFVVPRIME